MKAPPSSIDAWRLQARTLQPPVRRSSAADVTSHYAEARAMENETGQGSKARGSPPAGLAGMLWFGGWLFTIGLGKLVWWKIVLGLVVWPYFLGLIVR